MESNVTEQQQDTILSELLSSSSESQLQQLAAIYKRKNHKSAAEFLQELNAYFGQPDQQGTNEPVAVTVDSAIKQTYQALFSSDESELEWNQLAMLRPLGIRCHVAAPMNQYVREHLDSAGTHSIIGQNTKSLNHLRVSNVVNKNALVSNEQGDKTLTTDLRLDALIKGLPATFPKIFISEEGQDPQVLVDILRAQNIQSISILDVQAKASLWIDDLCADNHKSAGAEYSGFHHHEMRDDKVAYHSVIRMDGSTQNRNFVDSSNGVITSDSIIGIVISVRDIVAQDTQPDAYVIKCVEGKDRSPFFAWLLTAATLHTQHDVQLTGEQLQTLSHHFQYQIGPVCEMKYTQQLIQKFGDLDTFAQDFYSWLPAKIAQSTQSLAQPSTQSSAQPQLQPRQSEQQLALTKDQALFLYGRYCQLEYKAFKGHERLLIGLTIALAILGGIGGIICGVLLYKHRQQQPVMVAKENEDLSKFTVTDQNTPISFGKVATKGNAGLIFTQFRKDHKALMNTGRAHIEISNFR